MKEIEGAQRGLKCHKGQSSGKYVDKLPVGLCFKCFGLLFYLLSGFGKLLAQQSLEESCERHAVCKISAATGWESRGGSRVERV